MLQHVFDTIFLLRPYDIDKEKIYVGKQRDGGYVLAALPRMSDVLTFGVGYDVSFEYELAQRGHRVHLSDHTIAPTVQHERMDYRSQGVCGEGGNTLNGALAPLSDHLRRLQDPHGCILKMDVEGAEWDVFSTIDSNDLAAFDQIALEVHDLHRIDDPAFGDKVYRSLELLTSAFTLFHVHGNNCAAMHIVGNMPIVSVLELTFIRTSLVNRRNSQTFYPSINIANTPIAHDIPLFFYPFLPSLFEGDERRVTQTIISDASAIQEKILAGEPIVW